MRFYPNALQTLREIAQGRDCAKQCLYLVADSQNPHSKNAVMLHNGKTKLGSVCEDDAWLVRTVLDNWDLKANASAGLHGSGVDRKYPFVVACCIEPGQSYYDSRTIIVSGFNKVNERLARKFSDKFRKVV